MATSAPGSMAQNTLPGTATPESVAPAAKAATSRKRVFIVGGVVAAVALAGSYWAYSRQFEETDDAQVDGTISNISPRIMGTVTAVYVIENQTVKQGDVIADIDPTDLKIALDQAKAQVAQAQAQLAAEDPNVSITLASNVSAVSSAQSDLAAAQAALSGARNDVQQLSAQLAQAEANDRQAQLDKERSQRLVAQGAVSQADYDQHENTATASTANVEAVRQALAAAKDRVAQQLAQITALQSRVTEVKSNAPRQVATRTATLTVRQAALELAQAQEAEAETNLSYAKIVSPVSGIVAKKSIAVGDHVSPGQQIVAIAQTDDFWVTANYRETQLELVRPGQTATIHVDALGEDLSGTVESVGGATGARLSVLPPENAAGNFVKVVQRIPVRIHFEGAQASLDRLRIGMSVEPRVKVR